MESVPVRLGSRPRTILGRIIGADGAHCARAAFTRLELLAVLATLALLAAVALPVLAGNRVAADRLGCLNNLRQLGQAYHLWGHDHGGTLPCRTPHCEGGLRVHRSVCTEVADPEWAGFINNAWFHFAWISNELATASLLACPADSAARPAHDFSTAPVGGFLNPVFRNNAVSYLLALDIDPSRPLDLISSDHNVAVNGYYASCSSGVTTAASLLVVPSSPPSPWLPGPHGQTGNVLLYDGRVLQMANESFRQYFDVHKGDNGNLHLLKPRP